LALAKFVPQVSSPSFATTAGFPAAAAVLAGVTVVGAVVAGLMKGTGAVLPGGVIAAVGVVTTGGVTGGVGVLATAGGAAIDAGAAAISGVAWGGRDVISG